MGLIHNNQGGIEHGGKDGGAGADDDARLAFPGRQPVIQPFPVGEPGVQGDHRDGEALLEALYCLWGQADFWHQHHDLLAGGQQWRHGLQVDFRFAAAGDAVEEERGEAVGILNRLNGGALLGVGCQWCLRKGFSCDLRAGVHLNLLGPALFAQAAQGGRAYLQCRQHGAAQPLRVLTQNAQGVPLARRAADLVIVDVLPAVGDLPAFFQAGLGVIALAQQGWQGVIEHFAQRMVVIAGRPLAELVELVGHYRLVVEYRLHGLEFRVVAGGMAVHEADQGASPEGDFDPAAPGRHHGAVQCIVKTPGQGHGQGNLQGVFR